MFKVVQVMAAPASMSFLAVQVCAAASENESSKKKLLKVDELSLYTTPSSKSKYVEDSQTQLEDGISHLRHTLKPYTAWFQVILTDVKLGTKYESVAGLLQTSDIGFAPVVITGTFDGFYGNTMPKAEKTADYGRESYEFLKNPPPGFYPRLGVIGFAGVVGLFLARGSKIKKFMYPLSFMGIGASLYYPQQAIAIAKITGSQLYDWSLQAYINMESLWKGSPKKKKAAKATDKGDMEGEKTAKVQEGTSEEKAIK